MIENCFRASFSRSYEHVSYLPESGSEVEGRIHTWRGFFCLRFEVMEGVSFMKNSFSEDVPLSTVCTRRRTKLLTLEIWFSEIVSA